MSVLLISDLHLEESRPDITRTFLEFLDQEASQCSELYILGDFFEAWIGDDEHTELQVEIGSRLRRLSDQGIKIFFMHGNRDFMIGEDFAREAGMQLLNDPHLTTLGGVKTLLMHGDSLCTLDKEYMKFRAFVRNPQWQQTMLKRPLKDRQTMARQLRELSKAKNQGKMEEIMDVTPDEVVRVMSEQNVPRLIHGHTHRPAVHDLNINGLPAQRWVLGDWHHSFWFIKIDDNGTAELIERPMAAA